MKKRSLGKKLLFVGGILTVAFACQPKTPNMNSSQKPAEMQSDQDDDGDDGAYGDGDTSSCCDQNCTESLLPEEIVFELSEEELASVTNKIEVATEEKVAPEELVAKSDAVHEETLAQEVSVLEPMSPVEITPEHQSIQN